MCLSNLHFFHIMALHRFNFSLISFNYLTNTHHQILAWNSKTWLWSLCQNIRDVFFSLAIDMIKNYRVDAIFRASSKIWLKDHNLSFAVPKPPACLQWKKPKNLDKSLSEAHILNGFQCGGKVGKVNVASIKAVSLLDFFFWQRPGNIYKIIVMAWVNSVSLSKL